MPRSSRSARRRGPAGPLLLLLLLLSPSAAAAQGCAPQCGPGRWFNSLNLMAYTGSAELQQETDLALTAGLLRTAGEGRWMGRAELGGGVSLYGWNDGGFFGALHIALARAWTGQYLALADDLPAHFYVVGGGTGYLGWNMAEAPDDTELFPALALGAGLRVSNTEDDGGMFMVELLHEERARPWDDRLYLRLGVLWPRKRGRPTRPAPGRP